MVSQKPGRQHAHTRVTQLVSQLLPACGAILVQPKRCHRIVGCHPFSVLVFVLGGICGLHMPVCAVLSACADMRVLCNCCASLPTMSQVMGMATGG